MIASVVYTVMFLVFGLASIRFLLPRHRPLNRIWLGMSLGLLEEMWLPAIGAFFFSFGAEAHVFGAAVLFQLVTLPVEFNASRRAVECLSSSGRVSEDGIKASKKVLTAAAMTYVAALFVALGNMIRLILIVGRRK